MKKLILLIICLIYLTVPSFAEYIPIPENLKKQYKKDIEQVIKIEFNKKYSNIKNYDNIILKAKPENRYQLITIGLQDEIIDFLMPLVNITNKYVSSKLNLSSANYLIDIHNSLLPYFRDNNIDTRLVNKLLLYAYKKELKLRKKFLAPNDCLKDSYHINFKYNKHTETYSIDNRYAKAIYATPIEVRRFIKRNNIEVYDRIDILSEPDAIELYKNYNLIYLCGTDEIGTHIILVKLDKNRKVKEIRFATSEECEEIPRYQKQVAEKFLLKQKD